MAPEVSTSPPTAVPLAKVAKDAAKGLQVPGKDQAIGVSGSCEAFTFTRDLFCCRSDADITALFMLRTRHQSSRLVESYLKWEH